MSVRCPSSQFLLIAVRPLLITHHLKPDLGFTPTNDQNQTLTIKPSPRSRLESHNFSMIIRAKLLTLGLSLISIRSASAFQSTTPTSFGKRTARNEESIDQLSLAATSAKALPGTAKLDTPWEELGFEFRATNSHVRVTFKNDEWGEPELVKVRLERISFLTHLQLLPINAYFSFLLCKNIGSLHRFAHWGYSSSLWSIMLRGDEGFLS